MRINWTDNGRNNLRQLGLPEMAGMLGPTSGLPVSSRFQGDSRRMLGIFPFVAVGVCGNFPDYST